jgi:hypothetical protein
MNLDDLKNRLKAHYDETIESSKIMDSYWYETIPSFLGRSMERPALETNKTMWKPYSELEQLRKVAIAAARSVSNPAWAGVCDEDMELELALREAGFLPSKKAP